MDNSVLQAIHTRRSIRHYDSRQVKDEELQTVLEAGTWAPSGMGYQSPYIVAVQNSDIIARLVNLNKRFYQGTGNPYYDAPTIILVFGPKRESWRNTVQDASLVLGTMMLAAHSIGLGTCWINREIEMFEMPEGRELMHEFGLSDDLMGSGALSIGYPLREGRVKSRKADYFRVIK